MDAQKQETAKQIFLDLVSLPPGEERETRLNEVCSDDLALKNRVRQLLAANDRNASFLYEPAGGVATIDTPPNTEKPGTQIGAYKLREQIGEGGFGMVYVAEQTDPVSRKVALKIIKPGMDTREVIARFEAERQALALMDHPNVARVLDAGTTESGRPYFVMELVHGIPLTEFCDERNLTNRQRLRLFIDVCRAVQHAHQKGIIHRDLKPSNIMVTMHDDKPVPKVIDFGVSKALSQKLTEKTVYTAYGQMIGTPMYMSPEQAQMSGLDIDTRSDIYSLGVLLYELLTGTTPFNRQTLENAGYDELRRIIREDEPPRPSARVSTLKAESLSTAAHRRRIDQRRLSQSLRGELDWIVMKALEKDRNRRYDSPNSFADDIERYLSDEPVKACPPSVAYRIQKAAQRHKLVITTASLVTAALILGLIGTASQAVRANAERDAAEIERGHAVAAERKATTLRVQAEAVTKVAVTERKIAQRLLTSSQIDRAQVLCESGEMGRGMLWYAHALRTAPEDARDLERVIRTNLAAWQSELHSLRMLVQQDGKVKRVALSPDGSRMVSASDSELCVSNAATGKLIGEPLPHDGLQALAFSPKGRHFVSGNADGTAQLWDSATVRPIGSPLELEGQVDAMAFSTDGSHVIAGTVAGTVRIWNVATGELIGEPFPPDGIRRQGNLRQVRAVALTPAGARAVLSLDNGTQQLWDVDRGQPVGPPVDPMGIVRTAAVSPDGSRFATAGNVVIRVWDATTGEEAMPSMTHGAEILSLAFSPDGSRLASGGNERAARLWDATTGHSIGTPMRHRGSVYAVTFSHDGQQILTGSEDGTARLWDLSPETSLGKPVQHEDQLVATTFSADGLRILTERDGLLQIRDGDTGRPIGDPFPGETNKMKMIFSPDGSRVWLRGQIHDLATGQVTLQPDWAAYVHSVAFSPDGSRILIGDIIGKQFWCGQLWDARTAQRIGPRLQHKGVVSRVAFSPDGSRVVTGSFDATTQFWDASTLGRLGQPIVHQSEVKSLAWSPDGLRVATGFADWTVRLWDIETGEPLGLPAHHENIVSGAAFSPDGAHLLTASIDQTARLWDAETLKPIGPPLHHDGNWPRVSFAPQGTRMLLVGWSGYARLWEMPPGVLQGDVDRIVAWVQVVTGLELDTAGGTGVLDGPAWQERKRRLQELGGTPATSPILGPILPSTKTDFARTMNVALDGLRLAEQEQWEEAASKFHEAVQRSGDSPTLRAQIACWWDHFAANQLNSDQESCEKLTGHAITLLRTLGDDFPNADVYHKKLDDQYARLLHVFEETGRLDEALHAERQRVALYSELADRFIDDKARYGHELVKRQITLGIKLSRRDRTAEAEELFAGASRRLESIAEIVPRNDYERWSSQKFHQDVAELFAASGRDREVMVSYQRVLALNPQAHWIHHRLARLLLESRDPGVRAPALAVQHAKLAVEAKPQTAHLLKTLADAHASLALQHASGGREQEANAAWHKAAETYAKVIELQPRNMILWHGYTLAQLALSPEAYSQACGRLLEQLGRTEDPGVALSVAWFSGLGPGATSDPQRIVELAEQAIARLGKDKNRLYVLSVALYRAGRYEEAIEKLRETIAARGFASEWLYLAMAHHHLGDAGEARRCFEKACQWLKTAPARRWTGELHRQLLRREAAERLQIPESEQSDAEAAASPTPRVTD